MKLLLFGGGGGGVRTFEEAPCEGQPSFRACLGVSVGTEQRQEVGMNSPQDVFLIPGAVPTVLCAGEMTDVVSRALCGNAVPSPAAGS